MRLLSTLIFTAQLLKVEGEAAMFALGQMVALRQMEPNKVVTGKRMEVERC